MGTELLMCVFLSQACGAEMKTSHTATFQLAGLHVQKRQSSEFQHDSTESETQTHMELRHVLHLIGEDSKAQIG